MTICNYCAEGQQEMCEYFREHYLEDDGGAVEDCPRFSPQTEDEHGRTEV